MVLPNRLWGHLRQGLASPTFLDCSPNPNPCTVRRELERVRAVHYSQRYHQPPSHPLLSETSLLPLWCPLVLTKINGFKGAEAGVDQKAAEQQKDWEAMHVSQPGKQQPWRRAGRAHGWGKNRWSINNLAACRQHGNSRVIKAQRAEPGPAKLSGHGGARDWGLASRDNQRHTPLKLLHQHVPIN